MAYYEISLGFSKRSSSYVSAHFINHDCGVHVRLTKEKLYRFLSFHYPGFQRYARACRKYTFHELCEFLVHQDKYSFLPFIVSTHPVDHKTVVQLEFDFGE